MEKNYIKSVLFGVCFIAHALFSQTNLAPSATMSTNVLGNAAYPLSNMNDNTIVSCNSWTANGTWFGMSNATSGEYMDWTWTSAKSINKIIIYHGETSNRFLDAATIEYWTGSAWATWTSFSGLSSSSCVNTITFPTITTTALRLTNWNIASVGQVSNPCFREIEVMSGPSVNIDMGVSTLTQLDLCTGTQSISVKSQNFGKKTVDSFRLSWSVNGVLQTPVRYVTCALATLKDTLIVLNPTFSFTSSTKYKLKFWTSKPNGTIDSVAANDTFNTTLDFIGNPSPPSTAGFKQCGKGRPLLTCTPNSVSDSILWYDQSTLGNLLGIGKTILGPTINQTTTFYAQAMRFGSTKSLNNGFNGSSYYGYDYSGGMIDIKTFVPLSLDSITFRVLNNTATSGEIYYKSGTYVGFQTNASAWTLLNAGKGRVFSISGINYCRMSAKNLFLNSGQTYGFYLTTSPLSGTNYSIAKPGAVTATNSDISIIGGTLLAGQFGSTATAANYTIDAEFTSKLSCSNLTRTALTVTVKPRPIGANVIKGTVFKGQFRQGSPGQPDITSPSQQVSYELTPPTGYSNASHGTTWTITSVVGRTKGGVVVPATEYTTTNPSSSNNGLLSFNPSSYLCDSVVTFSITLQDLGPHFCDTIITRTIKIAPIPKTNFNFPNPVCDGTDIVFNNLTTVGCGGANNSFASYKWYFGDNDSSDSQNPIHLYKTYGCYPVRLVATSSTWNVSKDTTILVCVTEVPTVKFKVINACEGLPVKFLNQTTIGSGTLTYTWIYGDNSPNGITANPSHLYAIAGGYKVTLNVSSNGCKSSITKNAYQFAKPKSNFVIPATSICAKAPIDFPNTTTISLGDEGSLWSYGDGNSSTLEDGYNTYKLAGTYRVLLTSVSEFGCTDTISKAIAIKPTPVPTFVTNKLCSGEPTNFLNTTVETVANPVYTWTVSDNTTYTTKNITKSWPNEGTYTATLKADFTNGCSASASESLIVLIQPTSDFTVQDICSGEVARFVNLTTGDKGDINYKWDFGNNITSTDAAPTNLYTPLVTTTYTVGLMASYSGGCADTVTKTINVSEAPICAFSIQNQGFLKYKFIPANTSYSKYEWFFGEGGTDNVTSPSYKYDNESGFIVTMIATNSAGCKCTVNKSISVNSSIKNVSANSGFNIFPNPTTGIFKISSNGSSGMKIEVYSILGNKILSQVILDNETTINLSDVSKGIYLVKVTIDGISTTSKITVTN